jgi:hypothetical protein
MTICARRLWPASIALLVCAACPPPPQRVRPEELRRAIPGADALVVVY